MADLSKYLKQETEQKEENLINTGVNSNNSNIYEDYLRKKYLGVNLNVNQKAKLQHASVTDSFKELGRLANTFKLGEEVLKKSNLAGTWQGIKTKLNEKTGGFIGNSGDRGKLQIANHQYALGVADAENNGKSTNESRRKAQEMYNQPFASKEEKVDKITQGQRNVLNRFETVLQDLEAKGGIIEDNSDLYQTYINMRNKVEYLERDLYLKDGGNFDYEKYINAGKELQNESQIQKLKRFKGR